MKHPLETTIKLSSWIVFAALVSLILYPAFQMTGDDLTSIPENPIIIIIILIIFGGLGTLFWLKLSSKIRKVEWLFAFALVVSLDRLLDASGVLNKKWFIFKFAFIWVLVFCFLIATSKFRAIQQAKKTKKKVNVNNGWFYFNNIVIIIMVVVIGSSVGYLLEVWAVFLFLFIAAVYDAWAVWKTKHMIDLVNVFSERGLIPGIAQPSKKGKSVALLGAGDLFFISLVVASFGKVSFALALLAAMSLVVSLVCLLLFSKPKVYYPALPFMLFGLVVITTITMLTVSLVHNSWWMWGLFVW